MKKPCQQNADLRQNDCAYVDLFEYLLTSFA